MVNVRLTITLRFETIPNAGVDESPRPKCVRESPHKSYATDLPEPEV